MKLSILDQSPISVGLTARDALEQTVKVAQLAERLHYTRFWVSEHHDAANLAGSAPEVLLAHIGARTKEIRIGSGGVMLPHYSSYKVAENFRMLETLYSGRVDVGIGRAPGGMPRSTIALRGGRVPTADYEEQVSELVAYLTDTLPENHPLYGLRARPIPETTPEMWLLGSSDSSAEVAARQGIAFAFAHFINGDGGAHAVQTYRETFHTSVLYDAPQALAAVFVFCADTEKRADELASSLDLALLMLASGRPTEWTPTLEMAKNYSYTAYERGFVKENRKRMIVGDPTSVKQQLEHFASLYAVDELMLATTTPGFADRIRSFELIANVMNLTR
jgi:luciferase family oxidoreductase group 1